MCVSKFSIFYFKYCFLLLNVWHGFFFNFLYLLFSCLCIYFPSWTYEGIFIIVLMFYLLIWYLCCFWFLSLYIFFSLPGYTFCYFVDIWLFFTSCQMYYLVGGRIIFYSFNKCRNFFFHVVKFHAINLIPLRPPFKFS